MLGIFLRRLGEEKGREKGGKEKGRKRGRESNIYLSIDIQTFPLILNLSFAFTRWGEVKRPVLNPYSI